MKKIILFYPKTDHEKNYLYYWIPYSLLTIASGCIDSRYDILLIDENASSIDEYWNTITNDIDSIICIGISCMTGHQIENGIDFAKSIRKLNENIPIIWGGPHPTLFPKETLHNEYVDYVIQGQGELRLPLLIEHIISNKEKPYHLEGIGEKVDEKMYLNKGHVMADKKDFPPFPWHLLDLSKYIKSDNDINTRTLNYISSQGCPFHCGFCSEVALYSGKWTSFNVDRVIADIRYLVNTYELNGIKFYDANLFGKKRHALEIAKQLIPLDIQWAASGHPATLSTLTDDEWDLLKESGCKRLLIGLESGSQEVLDSIHKNFDIRKAISLAEKLRDHGMIGSFTFIVGFPNRVDKYEVEKTLELAKSIRSVSDKHECKIHFYAPYPGTPLWEDAIRQGFVGPDQLEDWASFDYYCIETPWMPKSLEAQIHLFNKESCPYVHL